MDSDASKTTPRPVISKVVAIKRFFEQPVQGYPERKLGIPEFSQLTDADKNELGPLCAEALGCATE